MNQDLASTLEQLAAGLRYPPQAFQFVLEGLEFAKTHVRHEIAPGADGAVHFDGVDLSWCLHDLALLHFGEHAREQLAAWGITRTGDFGEIVFLLVEAGLIHASEQDHPGQFHEVFSFADEFQYDPDSCIEIPEEEATSEASREPLRTPPRFGLKTLLIAVTLFCLGAGWFGWRWRHAEFQKELVAEIRAAGGQVYYEPGASGPLGRDFHAALSVVLLKNVTLTPELAGRIARARRLGSLQILDSRIEPEAMARIATLPQLATLQILGGEIRDEQAFAPLRGVPLYYLGVENTRLGEEHLRQIGRMTRVEELVFSETPLDDGQLAHLANLKQLRALTLQKTEIRGAGLRRLAGMERLESLNLNGSPIDVDGLTHLPPLPQLMTLKLSNTKITDDAMPVLERLPRLTYIALDRTAVTDAALAPLSQLPRLREIFADETAITKSAAEQYAQGRLHVVKSEWLFEELQQKIQASMNSAPTSPAAGAPAAP